MFIYDVNINGSWVKGSISMTQKLFQNKKEKKKGGINEA